jgi:hypothetical protein
MFTFGLYYSNEKSFEKIKKNLSIFEFLLKHKEKTNIYFILFFFFDRIFDEK